MTAILPTCLPNVRKFLVDKSPLGIKWFDKLGLICEMIA